MKSSKIYIFCALLVACCSCDNDFKVWKNLNANHLDYVCETRANTIKSTPSGVLYEVIYPVYHSGAVPKPESGVKVNYTGWLIDGTKFDSGTDATMSVEGLIQGWQEALCLMHEGEKWRIYVPYDLGYGEDGLEASGGNFSVPPYSTLIFDIELVKVYNSGLLDLD